MDNNVEILRFKNYSLPALKYKHGAKQIHHCARSILLRYLTEVGLVVTFSHWLFSLMAPKLDFSLWLYISEGFASFALIFFPPLRLGVCRTAKFDVDPIPSKQRASDTNTFYRETQLMYVHVGESDISVNWG